MAQRGERSAETRERILAAAAIEFTERGYVGASVGTIAERSGVGKSLVQYHFPAKSDIALAIITAVFDQASFANVVGAAPVRGIEAVIVSIRGVAWAFRSDIRVRAAVRLMREHALIDTPLPTPYVGWIAHIAGFLAEAESAQEITQGLDLDREAWLLVATFYGVQEVSDRLVGRDDLPGRIDDMLARSLRILGVDDVERRLADHPFPQE